jgi:hypothetical protein
VEGDPGEGPSERTRDKDVGSYSDRNARSPGSSSDETEREMGPGGPPATLYDWETANVPVYLEKFEDNPQAPTRSDPIDCWPEEGEYDGSSEKEEAIPLREDFEGTPRENNDHGSEVSDALSTPPGTGRGNGKWD